MARLRSTAEEALRRAGLETQVQEERQGELEGELKVEREWRQSMQKSIVTDRDKINSLQQEVAQLKLVAEVGLKHLTIFKIIYKTNELRNINTT